MGIIVIRNKEKLCIRKRQLEQLHNSFTHQFFTECLVYYHDVTRNLYLVFLQVPDTRASTTLGISWVQRASFVIYNNPLSTITEFMLMRWFLMGSSQSFKMELVIRGTNDVIRELELGVEFSALLPNLREGDRAGDWADHQWLMI